MSDKKKIFITNTGKILDDYIIVNTQNNGFKCDMVWDLLSNPPFGIGELEEIYINDFPQIVLNGDNYLINVITNLRIILKSDGLLKIGLAQAFQTEKFKSLLENLSFTKVETCQTDNTFYPPETIEPPVKCDDKLVKLHLGCGKVYLEKWTNIDNNSDDNIEKLDINFDLRNPLPYPENSVDYVFNEHFLEHLTVEESRKTLLDIRRVLKPEGKLRIAMPSIQGAISFYNNPNWKESPFMKQFGFDKTVKTRAEMLNMNFRSWGHQWLYDEEELERRLVECGFGNIKFCKWHESEDENLKNLETRKESNLIAEAQKTDFDPTVFID